MNMESKGEGYRVTKCITLRRRRDSRAAPSRWSCVVVQRDARRDNRAGPSYSTRL